MMLLPMILVIVHCKNIRKFYPSNGFFLVSLLSVYTFFSYYAFFNSFSITWLNNLVWLIISLAFFPPEHIPQLSQMTFRFLTYIGIGLATMQYLAFFLGRDRLFGNLRQISFYSVIALAGFLVQRGMRIKMFSWDFAYTSFCSFAIIISRGRLPLMLLLFLISVCLFFSQSSIEVKFFSILVIGGAILIFVHSNYFMNYMFRHNEGDRLSYSMLGDASFTSGRSAIYECAWNQFKDHPIWGLGYTSFKSPKNTYNKFWRRKESLSCHSTWLQYLAEIGIVGTSLYALILIWIIQCGLWIRRHTLQSSSSHHIADWAIIIGSFFILGGDF